MGVAYRGWLPGSEEALQLALGGGKGKRKSTKQNEIWKVEKRRQAFTYFKI